MTSCSATEWTCDAVTVNGEDVWDRTAEIRFDGERPVAVRAFLRRDGHWYLRGSGDQREVADEILTGEIVVTNLRRRERALA